MGLESVERNQDEIREFVEEFQDILTLAKGWNIQSDVIDNEINEILKCNCSKGDCMVKRLSNENHVSSINTRKNVSQILYSPLLNLLYAYKVITTGLVTASKLLFVAIALYFMISCHNPTQKFVMRHSQKLIYPIMRSVRLWSLPVIKQYTALTEWHEEECLLKNPLYNEPPLDCWPCEGVKTVVDLTGLYNYSKAYCFNERPFLVRDVMESDVKLEDLIELYKNHKDYLVSGTAKFVSNSHRFQTLDELFNNNESIPVSDIFSKETHISWKLNRVSSARVMRRVFHRPYFVPNNSEVALQRFLFIDGPESPQYFYPFSDFANVWLAQSHGYRLIVFDPTDSCKLNCTTISVLLKPRDVIYYNYQFWRPRSLSARLSDELSITYMGSFY